MHEFLLRELGEKGVYLPFEREKESLPNIIAALKELGFTGFNVTIPHKQNIIEYLDEIDEASSFFLAMTRY